MIAKTMEKGAKILKGKPFADEIKQEVAEEVEKLEAEHGFRPALTVVRVGEDKASEVYVGKKVKTSQELGIISEQKHLSADISEDELLKIIEDLNNDENIDGILVQLPLPDHINENLILETIDPEKDVDGFHAVNVGRLSQKRDALVPCTPAGVMEILERSGVEISGKDAVIVGRSNIVGKPMAMLLMHENATVTVCHSRTKDLPKVASRADILVAAIGRAGFIRGEHIKEGAIVIDVGINNFSGAENAAEMFGEDELEKRLRTIEKRSSTLVGDVNPKDAKAKAGMFTPVPGGVGLLTVAMLMKNTVKAAKMRRLKKN